MAQWVNGVILESIKKINSEMEKWCGFLKIVR